MPLPAVHGGFVKQRGWMQRLPLIFASIRHTSILPQPPFPFVVDTGANYTLILPYFERLLEIPERNYWEGEKPIETIGGPVQFRFLNGCNLIFTSCNYTPFPVEEINVAFYSPRNLSWLSRLTKRGRLIRKGLPFNETGKEVFPNVLGRDVLNKLGLGYCEPEGDLFITNQTNVYHDDLLQSFPAPFDPRQIIWRG
jgi:hypothetical protein